MVLDIFFSSQCRWTHLHMKQHLFLLTLLVWFHSCHDDILQSFLVLVGEQGWVLISPLRPETSTGPKILRALRPYPAIQALAVGLGQLLSWPGWLAVEKWNWILAHTCGAVWLLCPGRQGGLGSIWTEWSPPGRTKPELDCHGWTEKGICVFWGFANREALARILWSYILPLHG